MFVLLCIFFPVAFVLGVEALRDWYVNDYLKLQDIKTFWLLGCGSTAFAVLLVMLVLAPGTGVDRLNTRIAAIFIGLVLVFPSTLGYSFMSAMEYRDQRPRKLLIELTPQLRAYHQKNDSLPPNLLPFLVDAPAWKKKIADSIHLIDHPKIPRYTFGERWFNNVENTPSTGEFMTTGT